jgi:hypothetical protein
MQKSRTLQFKAGFPLQKNEFSAGLHRERGIITAFPDLQGGIRVPAIAEPFGIDFAFLLHIERSRPAGRGGFANFTIEIAIRAKEIYLSY